MVTLLEVKSGYAMHPDEMKREQYEPNERGAGAGCEVRGARCEVRGARCGVRGAGCGVLSMKPSLYQKTDDRKQKTEKVCSFAVE
jgi:hypothetical protein